MLIGGLNEDKLLSNILNYCLTISIARKFCWTGREKKFNKVGLRRLNDTELFVLVKRVVRKRFEKNFMSENIMSALNFCQIALGPISAAVFPNPISLFLPLDALPPLFSISLDEPVTPFIPIFQNPFSNF
jgi:hypothetical protein